VANTHDILERCAGLASATFPETGGACSARAVAIYLAHTGAGESLRAIAGAKGVHPSTVLRTVRRVEARRDDPLVASMFGALEEGAGTGGNAAPANANAASGGDDTDAAPGLARGELEREARRYLRRLCEPGAFLLVTPGAARGGIFCKADGFHKPIAMVPVGIAAAFLREGWIRLSRRGAASMRYRVTDEGRSALRRILAEDAMKRNAYPGFADAQTPFRAQHQLLGERAFMDPLTGEAETRRVNLGEDPLGWLARRKGPDGRPFLGPVEVEAGERLRLDFELAQMAPSVAQDWRKFLTPGDRLSGTPVPRTPGEGPRAARERVARALSALGPGLADVALRVCCFLEGLEACERRMGWAARAGKVVLKIALQRLAEHYGLALDRRTPAT
jgi:hypothetical protein